eukprot:646526-Prorocentrum_minimum.AAC.1
MQGPSLRGPGTHSRSATGEFSRLIGRLVGGLTIVSTDSQMLDAMAERLVELEEAHEQVAALEEEAAAKGDLLEALTSDLRQVCRV